jgi:hypothetical protein
VQAAGYFRGSSLEILWVRKGSWYVWVLILFPCRSEGEMARGRVGPFFTHLSQENPPQFCEPVYKWSQELLHNISI